MWYQSISAYAYGAIGIWRAVLVILVGLSLLCQSLLAESELSVATGAVESALESDLHRAGLADKWNLLDFSRFSRWNESGVPTGGIFTAPDFRATSRPKELQKSSVSFARELRLPGPVAMPDARQEPAGAASSTSSKTDSGGSRSSAQKKKSKLPWILAIAAGAGVGVALAMKKSSGDSSANNSDSATTVTVGMPTVGAP